MRFSRNPTTGILEVYTDDGQYIGVCPTMGDEVGMASAQDAEFEESKHPRDEKGRFTGGGGSSRSGASKPDTPERKASVDAIKTYGHKMRRFHIPMFIASRQKLIESLPDDYEKFQKMSPEEFFEYAEKKVPVPTSDVLKKSDEFKHELFVDPQKVMDADDHYAMLAVVRSEFMHITDDDFIRCIEDKDFCREKFLEAVTRDRERGDAEIDAVEAKYDSRLSDFGDITSYKLGIESIREEDRKNQARFGDATTPTETYYTFIEESQTDISFEDYVVQQAYVSGGLGLNAERLNQRMYAKEELEPEEQEFVDRLRSTAKPIPSDMVLYRMADEETLKHMFGNNDPQAGAETTTEAFSSTACGGMAQWWAGMPVAIRYHMKKGQKAIGMQNKAEGEVLLLNGAKLRVQKTERTSEDLPIWAMTGNIFSGADVGRQPQERFIVDVEVIDDGSNL